jgi:type III secretory pathway component EscV
VIGPQGRADRKEACIERVQGLLEQGLNAQQIASVVAISAQAVRRYVRKITEPETSKSLLELSHAKLTKASAPLVCGRSPTRSVAPQGPGVVDAKR